MTKKADLNRIVTLCSSRGEKGRMKKILSKTFFLFHLQRQNELSSQGWKLVAQKRFVTTALNRKKKEFTSLHHVKKDSPLGSFSFENKTRTISEKMQPFRERDKKKEKDIWNSRKRILGENIYVSWKRCEKKDFNFNNKIPMTPIVSTKGVTFTYSEKLKEWSKTGRNMRGVKKRFTYSGQNSRYFSENNSFSSPEQIPFAIQQSIEKSRPTLEVRKKRIGRNTRLIPSVVRRRRGVRLALHPLILGARKKGKTFTESFSQELLESFYGKGAGRDARDTIHKIAEGNRSFLRFRWW